MKPPRLVRPKPWILADGHCGGTSLREHHTATYPPWHRSPIHRSRATSKSLPVKPPRLLGQDSSGGVRGPGVGGRHKAASKPPIQSGPKSAAGRSRATSKSLPMGYPYFDITNERAQPCQKGLLEDHSGGYRIEPLRPDQAAPKGLQQTVGVEAAHPSTRCASRAGHTADVAGWLRPTGIL